MGKQMKTSMLINILQFPKKKGNNLNPWYVILWRLFMLPFMILFGIAFYVSYACFTLNLYYPEQFRKDYMITL
jgi:hypothetical protein